jgi:hypothetical protein
MGEYPKKVLPLPKSPQGTKENTMAQDTISAVLQSRSHVAKSIPSTTAGRKPSTDGATPVTAADVLKANEDKNNWVWVEIPDHDIFGEEHTGVSVNFQAFTPGKYFVSPEMGFEINRLLDNRMRGDIRVLQPRQDAIMARIMAKSQLGAPVNSDLKGLNDA